MDPERRGQGRRQSSLPSSLHRHLYDGPQQRRSATLGAATAESSSDGEQRDQQESQWDSPYAFHPIPSFPTVSHSPGALTPAIFDEDSGSGGSRQRSTSPEYEGTQEDNRTRRPALPPFASHVPASQPGLSGYGSRSHGDTYTWPAPIPPVLPPFSPREGEPGPSTPRYGFSEPPPRAPWISESSGYAPNLSPYMQSARSGRFQTGYGNSSGADAVARQPGGPSSGHAPRDQGYFQSGSIGMSEGLPRYSDPSSSRQFSPSASYPQAGPSAFPSAGAWQEQRESLYHQVWAGRLPAADAPNEAEVSGDHELSKRYNLQERGIERRRSRRARELSPDIGEPGPSTYERAHIPPRGGFQQPPRTPDRMLRAGDLSPFASAPPLVPWEAAYPHARPPAIPSLPQVVGPYSLDPNVPRHALRPEYSAPSLRGDSPLEHLGYSSYIGVRRSHTPSTVSGDGEGDLEESTTGGRSRAGRSEEPQAGTSERAAGRSVSSGDERQPKRNKKTEIACNFCRGRKLRCDGQRPICHHCRKRGVPCEYAAFPKRRGPGKATKKRRQMASKSEEPTPALTREPRPPLCPPDYAFAPPSGVNPTLPRHPAFSAEEAGEEGGVEASAPLTLLSMHPLGPFLAGNESDKEATGNATDDEKEGPPPRRPG